jgi:hypothetical protein
MRFRTIAIAFSFVLAPAVFTASFAQSSGGGSDIPKATTQAGSAGATTNGTLGTKVGSSLSPTNGTQGGGMSTGSGMKAGGQARKSKIKKSAP